MLEHPSRPTDNEAVRRRRTTHLHVGISGKSAACPVRIGDHPGVDRRPSVRKEDLPKLYRIIPAEVIVDLVASPDHRNTLSVV